MVDRETQNIRDEVIRAMVQHGEDVESLGIHVPAEAEAEGAHVAMPAWDRVVEKAAEGSEKEAAEEAAMGEEETERLFLAAVFDDARAQSGNGRLSQPSQWLDAGLVPAHFAAEDWEMFVYEYLEERKAERDARAAAAPASPVRTATCAVGVPRMLRAKEPAPEGAQAPGRPDSVPEGAPGLCRPARSVEEVVPKEPERRGSAAPAPAPGADPAPDPAPAPGADPDAAPTPGAGPAPTPDAAPASVPYDPPCDDIVALVGKRSYYLYSTARMTDAYARWAFLACEDDRVLTFVECVRDESRTYPRPMEASSLSNEPFNLSDDEIDELWRTVSEGGAYPDLETVTASNGDVYYYSTEYLTPAYAASLAEWSSVERDRYL